MGQQTDKITIGAGGELTRNSTTGELGYSKDGTAPNNVPLSQGFLGEVKTSILDETQFQSLAGAGWILMDGRTITGSDLHTLDNNWTNAPDTRAQFLRGNDDGGSGEGAAGIDTGRAVGTSQGQLTKLPSNNFTGTFSGSISGSTSGGGHEHIIPRGSPSGAFGAYVQHADNATGTSSASTLGGGGHSHSLSGSSSGSTSTTGGGDAETRPINITVNYFIKINY